MSESESDAKIDMVGCLTARRVKEIYSPPQCLSRSTTITKIKKNYIKKILLLTSITPQATSRAL